MRQVGQTKIKCFYRKDKTQKEEEMEDNIKLKKKYNIENKSS